MSLTTIAGVTFPTEWLYWIPITLFIAVPLFLFWKRKHPGDPKARKTNEEGSPIDQQMALVLKVDENNTLQLGKLLEGVKQTDKDLLITDPDILDSLTELPKEFHVSYEDIVPAQVVDATRNLITFWLILLRKGEYHAASFASIVNQVRTRFDPLPADPRDVGGHYVPMPWSKSGLTQLLQSNTGKFLVFSAAILLGLFGGLILGHVTHF